MKIAIAQLNSSDDINQNLDQLSELITKASEQKPEIIFFPENSLFFRLSQDEKVVHVKMNGPEISALKSLSAKYQMAIHFTSAVEEDGHVFNASVLVKTDRSASVVYKKLHLFDIALQGQKPIRES